MGDLSFDVLEGLPHILVALFHFRLDFLIVVHLCLEGVFLRVHDSDFSVDGLDPFLLLGSLLFDHLVGILLVGRLSELLQQSFHLFLLLIQLDQLFVLPLFLLPAVLER